MDYNPLNDVRICNKCHSLCFVDGSDHHICRPINKTQGMPYFLKSEEEQNKDICDALDKLEDPGIAYLLKGYLIGHDNEENKKKKMSKNKKKKMKRKMVEYLKMKLKE